MNTSFSKKRHISDVNILLERRFLVETSGNRDNKILNEQSETPESFAAKLGTTTRTPNREQAKKSLLTQLNMYPSIQGPKGVDFLRKAFDAYARIYGVSFPDTLASFFIVRRTDSFDKTYVADTLRKNGVTIDVLPNSYKFTFPPYKEPIKNLGPATPEVNKDGSPAKVSKKTSNFTDCSTTGVFKLNCKDTRPKEQNEIMKIQSCLGVKADGYFGNKTTAALNSKFPNLGGVVKSADITTICQSQVPAPQVNPYDGRDDNNPELDPRNQPPQPRDVIQPVTPLVNNPSPPRIEAPQVRLSPQQKSELTKQYRDLGARYNEERSKLLKANPGMTEDQVKQQLSQMITQLNDMYPKIK